MTSAWRLRVVWGIGILLAVRATAAPGQTVPCPSAMSPRPMPLAVSAAELRAARRAPALRRLGSLAIVIVPGPTLAANAAALAAWDRAAARWAAIVSDPITVTIDADLQNMGDPNVIGATGATFLVGDYATIRDQLVADALLDAGDGVVAALPSMAGISLLYPVGSVFDGNIVATKANLKAAGFEDLDVLFGASDASITFNTQFPFDFDASDGVSPGLIDFETVATHELGHALGFISAVDDVDALAPGAFSLMPLDLFRFQHDTAADPATAPEFTSFPRDQQPGVEDDLDDLAQEWRMSMGLFTGDGRQASHWKDNELTGTLVGVMDPTLAFGVAWAISSADERAVDVIGWDVAGAAGTTTTSTTTPTVTTTSTTLPACTTDADCDDGDPCTRDRCAAGPACAHEVIDEPSELDGHPVRPGSLAPCAAQQVPPGIARLARRAARAFARATRPSSEARMLRRLERGVRRLTRAVGRTDRAEAHGRILGLCTPTLRAELADTRQAALCVIDAIRLAHTR